MKHEECTYSKTRIIENNHEMKCENYQALINYSEKRSYFFHIAHVSSFVLKYFFYTENI